MEDLKTEALERENKAIKKKLADKTQENAFLQRYLVFITVIFVALILYIAR